MSYHIGARVLERLRGRTESAQLAQGLRHVLCGELPAQRFILAAHALRGEHPSSGAIERQVRELWALDLNPAAQLARQVRSARGLEKFWNAYNARGNVALPSRLTVSGQGARSARLASGNLPNNSPMLMDVALALVDVALDTVRRSVERHRVGHQAADHRVSDLALVLGSRSSVVYETSLCFEANPGLSIAKLSRELGCHPRTLARQFRAVGLTPVELRRACRLVGATRDLWTGLSLTEIAMTHGYADLGHFSREVSRATGGMSPRFLRQIASVNP